MNKEQLKAYFEGKLSEVERREVEKHLNAVSESDTGFQKAFEDQWEAAEDLAADQVFSDVLFNEIESEIDGNQKKSIQFAMPNWTKYAAAIVLLAVSSLIVFNSSLINEKSTVATVEMVHKVTSKGQKSTIMLSDGSTVILNAGSSLSYPKRFTDSTRMILLKGEAFFEVAKDKSRPFSVIANGVRTTALGTSFNINSKHEETKVSLATGKVVVKRESENTSEKYFLSPGESIHFNNEEVVKSEFDFKKDLFWKDGVLYFENEDFNTIIKTLESWYDVSVTMEHQPKEFKLYTGQFNNEPLSNVLENMGFALGFDYFLNEKKVTLIFN